MIFPLLIKEKKKKNKKSKNVYNGLDINNNNEKEKEIPLKYIIPESHEIPTIIKIINKEKGIKEKVSISNKDYNKTLLYIDELYISKYNNMVYEKNNIIKNIVNNNYKYISYLRKINNKKELLINKINSENFLLKEDNEILRKENKIIKSSYTKKEMVDIKNNKKIYKNDFQNKLKLLYNKYINLYEIFNKYKNYKLINLDEIKKYTKDKNIYKIKQRSTKVFNFYENFKKGYIKELLPVSSIFKMVF